ncbi:hypothetical protein KDK88_09475, partial [bacterium]|nr:hypothetical protein [bacterium]
YTITWQTIAGWIEPAPETAVMPTESGLVFTGTYVAAPSAWSLTISPEPEGIHAPWSLAGPGGFFESGVGARTVIVGTRGLYTATWENVPGWLTPEPLAVDLGIDADVTLSSAYTEQPSASTVVVNPVPGTLMAPWRVDGPGGLVRTGNGYARLTDMPIGLYSVSWEAVYGWNEPAGSTQTLAVNGTITFDGIYEVQETGTVVIDPDPDTLNAGWTLTGPDSSYSGTGNGDTTLQDMALGTYRVDWEVIPDLVTPPSTELVLAADQTITFHGEYVTGTVMIDVDITPDNGSAAWTLRGPGGFEATGSSDRTFAPMPPGEYSVEWADLLFWTTPTTPPMTLTPNGTITFTGRYIGGTLNVDTEPDALSGMWTVVGSHETRTGSGDATLLDLPPTDYTVTWDSIPGWFTPLPEHVDFWDFPVASVQGVYAKGAILIDPEPDALNASWSLAGPDGFTADGSGDELVADLAPGVYSVTWGVVAGWIAPSAQTLYYTDSPDTLHVVGTYVEN